MTTLELLAPARNADIGIAAIRCGADAVYIGGPRFGARAAAGNSVREIAGLCDYASRFGAKVFVTVNTLANDDKERKEISEMMAAMKNCGISAFILQDTTLLPFLAEYGEWDEEFHASTQCAIRTPERALELSRLGFTRLILERELSLEQISRIRAAIPESIELEAFVHGALCVCYSGDCYLSEYLTGRSANRGECAQPCRSKYDLKDADGNILISGRPLLSLKDLELIGDIPKLAGAGIVSFKIEGRLKNESYVKNVTRAYSRALDSFIASHPDEYCRASFGIVKGGFVPNLDKTFNRGYTSLFIDGTRGGWNSGDYAKGMGEYLGRIKSVEKRGQMCVLELNGSKTVNNGDGLCCVVNGEVEGLRADKVENGRIFCKGVSALAEGMDIWRNRDIVFERELERNEPTRFLRAIVDVEIGDKGMIIRSTCENGSVAETAIGTRGVPVAENQERMRKLILEQLGKSSGDYTFTVRDMKGCAALPLLSAAALNSARREIAGILAGTTSGTAPAKDNSPLPACSGNLTHPRRKGELMRTRYCLLAELGKCLKTPEGREFAGKGLFLENNGRSIPLSFDCKACEMVLVENK